MTLPKEAEVFSPLSSPFIPAAWDKTLARWISQLGSPPLLAAAGLILCGQVINTWAAWEWIGFYILLAVGLPAGYVLWLVRRGQVTDFDLRLREQRLRPLVVTLLSAAAAWLVLYGGSAPHLLRVLAGAGWAQIALLLAITLRWKISAHCASAAGFVVWAWALFGVTAAPLTLVVPLIAWSRLRLGRHDLPQTVAGSLLGSTVLAAVLFLAG